MRRRRRLRIAAPPGRPARAWATPTGACSTERCAASALCSPARAPQRLRRRADRGADGGVRDGAGGAARAASCWPAKARRSRPGPTWLDARRARARRGGQPRGRPAAGRALRGDRGLPAARGRARARRRPGRRRGPRLRRRTWRCWPRRPRSASRRCASASCPAVISPYVVQRARGRAARRRLFLTGRAAGADEALRVGLADEVAPADGLDAAVERVVRRPAARRPGRSPRPRPSSTRVDGPRARRRAGAHRRADRATSAPARRPRPGLRAFLERQPAPWVGASGRRSLSSSLGRIATWHPRTRHPRPRARVHAEWGPAADQADRGQLVTDLQIVSRARPLRGHVDDYLARFAAARRAAGGHWDGGTLVAACADGSDRPLLRRRRPRPAGRRRRLAPRPHAADPAVPTLALARHLAAICDGVVVDPGTGGWWRRVEAGAGELGRRWRHSRYTRMLER